MKLDCSIAYYLASKGKELVEEEYDMRQSYKLEAEIIRDEVALDVSNKQRLVRD